MSNRLEQAYDSEVRIESVVDFASMLASFGDLRRVPDQLGQAIEDSFEDRHLHPSMKTFMEAIAEKVGGDDEDLLERLQLLPRSFSGLIFMQGATPRRNYHSETGWSSGWGHYYTQWVAAETFDAAWELLVAWAEAMHEEDKSKVAA